MKKTELLLPAGKYESLRAAVANGADAVYLSGTMYGARAGAGNFDEEEIKRAVKLCHSKGVKVYVTMNTLMKDRELSAALDYAKFLYDLGVDALIVQDLGLAGAIKKLLPAFALNGSTQMTIHNVATAKWAYQFGFRRVILAREMTLTEIKAIHEAVPLLELEVFCHGALCICYSGQCLMSSLIGGRSGNRGQCAQPCRLQYQLWDPFRGSLSEEASHLLSPRDLNTLDELTGLIAMGVVSFKVEGRMRRPEYVATVGRVYREALDNACQGEKSGHLLDKEGVKQVFNRDFTSAYLHGNPGIDLMSHQKPNNRGVLLGRVKYLKGKIIGIEVEKELYVDDGIEIWVKVGGRVGCIVSDLRVNGKNVTTAYPGDTAEILLEGRIQKGDRIFKTYDSVLMREAAASYEALSEDIPLSFQVKAILGQPLTMAANDGNGHCAEVVTNFIVEKAKKTPTDFAMVEKQLSRLGGSGYGLKELTCTMDSDIILPASVLNRSRRQLTEELDAALFHCYPKIDHYTYEGEKENCLALVKEKDKHNVAKLSVKVRDIYQVNAALDAGADRIYFAPHFGLEEVKKEAFEELSALIKKYPDAMVFALPTIRQDTDNRRFTGILESAIKSGFRQFLLGQVGDITLKETYPEMEVLYGDVSLNVMNNQTAKTLYEEGLKQVTASLELTKEGLSALANTAGEKEVFVHGYMPMMVSRHCLIGACVGKDIHKVPCGISCFAQEYYLRDRMDMLFPIRGDRYHHMHIYNCKELALIDELRSLTRFQSWRIEGQFYDIGTLKEIISLYRIGGEQAYAKGEYQKEMLFESLNQYTKMGFTKGHFYRGVK